MRIRARLFMRPWGRRFRLDGSVGSAGSSKLKFPLSDLKLRWTEVTFGPRLTGRLAGLSQPLAKPAGGRTWPQALRVSSDQMLQEETGPFARLQRSEGQHYVPGQNRGDVFPGLGD